MHLNSLMIRASAGSGKTFQLSNRFLALLAAGADPSSVIALTFTRKAAGEFADRILSRLAEGALDAGRAAALANEIGLTLAGNPATGMPGLSDGGKAVPLDLASFQRLLEGLVANLHRVALSTLDSFFVRMSRAISTVLMKQTEASAACASEAWSLGLGIEALDQRPTHQERLLTRPNRFADAISSKAAN